MDPRNNSCIDPPEWYWRDQLSIIYYMDQEYCLGHDLYDKNSYAIWVNLIPYRGEGEEELYTLYMLCYTNNGWEKTVENKTEFEMKEIKMNEICKIRFSYLKNGR